jgi:hypothetical protein
MPSIYQLQKHKFNNVDNALQLLIKCWQQIHTHLSKPSDPLNHQYRIRDEFTDSLCALQKLFTDIQAEHSKDQKPVHGRWKQAKIAEDDISFSEDYPRTVEEEATKAMIAILREKTSRKRGWADQCGSFEELDPADSEESVHTQKTRKRIQRNINRYSSARYYTRTASVKSQRRASKIPLANDQNYKQMRDDNCDGNDVCKASSDGQYSARTQRRIPAPNKRGSQRRNHKVD